MPRNNKNLVAKDIDGKKIREQYFDGLIIGLCIFAICYIIFCLFNIENFKNMLLPMLNKDQREKLLKVIDKIPRFGNGELDDHLYLLSRTAPRRKIEYHCS